MFLTEGPRQLVLVVVGMGLQEEKEQKHWDGTPHSRRSRSNPSLTFQKPVLRH